jgi:hypothetical protein
MALALAESRQDLDFEQIGTAMGDPSDRESANWPTAPEQLVEFFGEGEEISDLVGQVRVTRRTWQTGAMAGRTFSGEDIAILRPEEIRRLKERHAPILAETATPSLRA